MKAEDTLKPVIERLKENVRGIHDDAVAKAVDQVKSRYKSQLTILVALTIVSMTAAGVASCNAVRTRSELSEAISSAKKSIAATVKGAEERSVRNEEMVSRRGLVRLYVEPTRKPVHRISQQEASIRVVLKNLEVHTNTFEQDIYDPASGLFRAPETGVYSITARCSADVNGTYSCAGRLISGNGSENHKNYYRRGQFVAHLQVIRGSNLNGIATVISSTPFVGKTGGNPQQHGGAPANAENAGFWTNLSGTVFLLLERGERFGVVVTGPAITTTGGHGDNVSPKQLRLDIGDVTVALVRGA